MSTVTHRAATPLPIGASIAPGTLRAELEKRRATATRCSLRETVAAVVPLATELHARHARGERFHLHASSVALDESGALRLDPAAAAAVPTLPRDRACLAPEVRSGGVGDARASVYALGAIIYEMLTGESVGPAMRRPSELVPGLEPAVEAVLGKALIGDRAHRPDDLGALAQALHHLAPSASLAPPPADEAKLDRGDDFTVDVSLSMLPPPPKLAAARPAAGPSDPYAAAPREAPKPVVNDAASRLTDLKARLESDARPRYVVVKDGMDHGPFSAVELLQQIASHTFEDGHGLRDTLSGDERPIREWEEFAPFAEQAKLHREVVAEKQELEKAVVQETRGTRRTTLVAGGVLALLAVGVAGWALTSRGERSDAVAVATDDAVNVDTDAGIKGQKRKPAPVGGGGVAAGGGVPVIAGGQSCEAAQEKYVQELNIGGPKGPADLTAGQFGAVLNNGSYVVSCGAPASMKVHVCAAVQNGHAVGVTVTTEPMDRGIAGCIAGRVRGMSFPVSPRLDVTRTNF